MSSPNSDTVQHEVVGRVAVLKINRPKQLNALNGETLMTIIQLAVQYDEDDQVGAIILTGNERAFAAGADIKEMAGATPVTQLVSGRLELWEKLRGVKKPIIAAVSGWCLGGGNELAMACDIILASESAKFGQPEINIGIMPGGGGTQRLTRIVGKSIAMEMCLNGRFLSAAEALHYGLAARVYPPERLMAEALKMAQEIAERAPLAIRLTKAAVNQAYETYLADGLRDERSSFHLLFSSEDQKEGMAAFIEKRRPEWKGR